MNSTFSALMSELAKKVPNTKMVVSGEEFRRVAILTPIRDGKERFLYWHGADPEPNEYASIVTDLINHLKLVCD